MLFIYLIFSCTPGSVMLEEKEGLGTPTKKITPSDNIR